MSNHTTGEKFNIERYKKHGEVSVRQKDSDKYRKEFKGANEKSGKHKTLGAYTTFSKAKAKALKAKQK